MEKIKSFFSIVLIFFLSSCCCQNNIHKAPKYEKLADKITFKTIKNLKNAKELKLIGSGGSMLYNVKLISLHFYCYHSTSIDQARSLLLEITSNLISAFNANEEIRPFLANYPFNEKNLEISITFVNKYNDYQSSPSISTASARNAKIYYYNYSTEKERLVNILDEPYEEAVNKARIPKCEFNSPQVT